MRSCIFKALETFAKIPVQSFLLGKENNKKMAFHRCVSENVFSRHWPTEIERYILHRPTVLHHSAFLGANAHDLVPILRRLENHKIYKIKGSNESFDLVLVSQQNKKKKTTYISL